MCGLTRNRAGSSSKIELRTDIPKWVYRYERQPGKWTRILPNEQEFGEEPVDKPQPRYAHQLVYNPNTDSIFMHGGNGGVVAEGSGEDDRGDDELRGEEENRLDDFWTMKLKRYIHSTFNS